MLYISAAKIHKIHCVTLDFFFYQHLFHLKSKVGFFFASFSGGVFLAAENIYKKENSSLNKQKLA